MLSIKPRSCGSDGHAHLIAQLASQRPQLIDQKILGRTALHCAAEGWHDETAAQLLALRSLLIDAVDNDGNIAVFCGSQCARVMQVQQTRAHLLAQSQRRLPAASLVREFPRRPRLQCHRSSCGDWTRPCRNADGRPPLTVTVRRNVAGVVLDEYVDTCKFAPTEAARLAMRSRLAPEEQCRVVATTSGTCQFVCF